MLRRIALISLLTVALGAGVVIAGGTVQKEKTPKAKDQTEQKDKDKALVDSVGALTLDLGGDGGYLGVYLEEVTPERTKELNLKEERGAIVMKVVAGSPAEKSGLKENDVIVSFNGRRVDSVRELQRLLNETPPERAVQIEVVRGGSHQTLATTLSKRALQQLRAWGPGMDSLTQNHDLFKQEMDAFKDKAQTLPQWRDFGDFSFVNPGDFMFFGGNRLGLSAESLTDQLAEFFGVKDKGVLVAAVDENGPAAKAGIKAGDVIVAVDNEKVDSVRALMRAMSNKKEGTAAIKIVRNHAEQTINLTIEKREPTAPRRRAISTTRHSTIV